MVELDDRDEEGEQIKDESLVYRFGVKENVVKGLGIASILGVIGFAAFKGYSKLKELERLKADLEQQLLKK